jgi:hypothetical protein
MIMAGSETRKSIGTRRTASARSTGRSRKGSGKTRSHYPLLAICINNRGNEASLQKGKVYQIIEPHPGDRPYDVRVIDEEGEDYLYSAEQFVPIDLPPQQRRVVQEAVEVDG